MKELCTKVAVKDSVLCANRGFGQSDVLGTQPSISGTKATQKA